MMVKTVAGFSQKELLLYTDCYWFTGIHPTVWDTPHLLVVHHQGIPSTNPPNPKVKGHLIIVPSGRSGLLAGRSPRAHGVVSSWRPPTPRVWLAFHIVMARIGRTQRLK